MITKLLPILCGGLITISISISGWTMKEVVELRTKVATIEASRFSASDGLEIWKEVGKIKENISKNDEAIKNLPPPIWFQNDIKAMEDRLNLRLNKVEDKIDNLPKKR